MTLHETDEFESEKIVVPGFFFFSFFISLQEFALSSSVSVLVAPQCSPSYKTPQIRVGVRLGIEPVEVSPLTFRSLVPFPSPEFWRFFV